MKIYVTGAAVVRNGMVATLHSGSRRVKTGDLFQIPHLGEVFAKKSSRFGRFDRYTRTGCAAAGLALHDAGLYKDKNKDTDRLRNTGFILSGRYGSFATDLAFYETTRQGGQFASPNLFSYTLPNIVIGECALQFGLTGPTFCLDSEGGRAHGALYTAALLLEENPVGAMLAGWLEVLPAGAPGEEEGAIVLVFEKKKNGDTFQLELETGGRKGMRFPNGEEIDSIDQLVRALEILDSGIGK